MLQLLLFSGLAFFIMLPYLKRTLTITLDWDWLYRWLAPRVIDQATRVVDRWHRHRSIDMLRHIGHFFGRLFLYHGPQGIMARTWATGSMVLWVVILLGIYLVAYYY